MSPRGKEKDPTPLPGLQILCPIISRESYPCARGEQFTVMFENDAQRELSLLARGAGSAKGEWMDGAGIIPAHAGSRERVRREPVRQGDHPRACGEQKVAYGLVRSGQGSSLRMRGAGRDIAPSVSEQRIIPAHAGSRLPSLMSTEEVMDHPRACGEQTFSRNLCSFLQGSSPRVRGAAQPDEVRPHGERIIPARAGSSRPCRPASVRARDHPRACGEQFPLSSALAARTGSSPRVRGAVSGGSGASFGPRIIPARAGSSSM